jgi:hypothetical protein
VIYSTARIQIDVGSGSRAASGSMGHYENRWSEVHPEANLRDGPPIDGSPVPQLTLSICKRYVTGSALLDHLIGAGEQRRWHRQAQRLGSLQIDHQLVFRRLFHGQVGWLGTFENFVDVGRGTTS